MIHYPLLMYMLLVISSLIVFEEFWNIKLVYYVLIKFNFLNKLIISFWWIMDRSFVQVWFTWEDCLLSRKSFDRLGKPSEVLASAEHLLSSSKQSSQASTATTHRSATDIEEQVIQTENALQNEEEQRCTGKEQMGECPRNDDLSI